MTTTGNTLRTKGALRNTAAAVAAVATLITGAACDRSPVNHNTALATATPDETTGTAAPGRAANCARYFGSFLVNPITGVPLNPTARTDALTVARDGILYHPEVEGQITIIDNGAYGGAEIAGADALKDWDRLVGVARVAREIANLDLSVAQKTAPLNVALKDLPDFASVVALTGAGCP